MKLTLRCSACFASTQFSRSPAAMKSTRISLAHDTCTPRAELSWRSICCSCALMSPLNWPDSSTVQTCLAARLSSSSADAGKLDERSLAMDSGSEAAASAARLGSEYQGGDERPNNSA